ncbi:MAG TPA: GntR family transcriptional regulator [Thermoleophilaceae bacterium]|jgi:DNA-binding transcriptional regulator YhcF (GntR family)
MAHFPFDLELERSSDVPLGTQLAWKLRAAIAGGAMRAGDRLPPVRELAAAAGVNVNTVRAVYARLAKQGVIVSEHGRGTFVAEGPRRGAGLAELIERAARDARSHDVDPRELAALLYARFDAGAATPIVDDEHADARRALRAEIEALEHELTALEPLAPDAPPEPNRGTAAGARLVTLGELEATRDALAQRTADRRYELRVARTAARQQTREPEATESSAWPELLPLQPRPA